MYNLACPDACPTFIEVLFLPLYHLAMPNDIASVSNIFIIIYHSFTQTLTNFTA